MNILIVGPSIERTKGGMATVIQGYLNDDYLNNHHSVTHLVSHVEGSAFEKISYIARGIVYIIKNRRKIDILHMHAASGASFYRKLIFQRVAKLFNKKTIIHLHGADFDSFYYNSKPWLKKTIKKGFRKCDKVLVLSEHWKAFINKHIVNSDNVLVLKNGIDVDEFKECINDHQEFSRYLFLGRLGKRKGIYDLLEAIDLIVNRLQVSNFVFYLAGDGEIDEVNKLIEEKKLAPFVKMLGWLNKQEKLKILRETDCLILPSYDEGLPMSLIEAMSCGKVLISTYVGGIPDMIKHDLNGYLFKAGEVEMLKRLILYVNEEREKSFEIKINNINTARKEYNTTVLSVELHNIYQMLA